MRVLLWWSSSGLVVWCLVLSISEGRTPRTEALLGLSFILWVAYLVARKRSA